MNHLIFHRFDDIGPYNDNTINILDRLEELCIPSIVAVIPNKLERKMADYIKELKYCIVAQHGVNHLNKVNAGWLDEFPEYLDKCIIKKQIRDGRNYLKEVLQRPITTYIPPWNNTSRQTVEILEELGFQVYSSQYNKLVESTMLQVPISIDVAKSYHPKPILKPYDIITNEVQNTIKYIENHFIGIMYHPNEFLDNDVEMILNLIENYKAMAMEYFDLRELFMKIDTKEI